MFCMCNNLLGSLVGNVTYCATHRIILYLMRFYSVPPLASPIFNSYLYDSWLHKTMWTGCWQFTLNICAIRIDNGKMFVFTDKFLLTYWHLALYWFKLLCFTGYVGFESLIIKFIFTSRKTFALQNPTFVSQHTRIIPPILLLHPCLPSHC